MQRKGRKRNASRDTHPGSKISSALARQVAAEYRDGHISIRALAKKYGVGRTCISNAVRHMP